VTRMHTRALVPLDGTPGKLARTGIKSHDFRELVGFTAREVEAVAGISGQNVMYVVDEASGVDDLIFEAIKGNLAGGGILVLLGNPTRTEGEHFDSFYDERKKDLYVSFRISSEETPNVVNDTHEIPGLATREWVEEMRLEYGEESALYKIRVRGEHALAEDGKILSAAAIVAAQDRWEDTPAEGRLVVGVDPAGRGLDGDETVFAIRRGMKIVALYAHRGLSTEDHVAHLLGYLKEQRHPKDDELPQVNVDGEGPIGSDVYYALKAHAAQNAGSFEIARVRSSEPGRALKSDRKFDRVRDALWGNLERWLRDGGAIPADLKLGKELHAPSWVDVDNALWKATPKSELRKMLDRSPDRADAVALAVWEPPTFRAEDYALKAVDGKGPFARYESSNDAGAVFDPYGGAG
jgi:phage terminase large subunit